MEIYLLSDDLAHETVVTHNTYNKIIKNNKIIRLNTKEIDVAE